MSSLKMQLTKEHKLNENKTKTKEVNSKWKKRNQCVCVKPSTVHRDSWWNVKRVPVLFFILLLYLTFIISHDMFLIALKKKCKWICFVCEKRFRNEQCAVRKREQVTWCHTSQITFIIFNYAQLSKWLKCHTLFWPLCDEAVGVLFLNAQQFVND